MKKLYRLAVIGSRETDQATMHEMYMVLLRGLNMLGRRGITFEWLSGGCWKGPDQLQFEMARQWRNTVVIDPQGKAMDMKPDGRFICYLPDEKKLAWLSKLHPNVEFRIIAQDGRYRDIVEKLHPNPTALKEFAWNLHGRNLNIIMGDQLDTPVDAVYFSAPLNKHGEPTGGTAMGVKYAKQCGIPCYNHVNDARAWLESLRLL